MAIPAVRLVALGDSFTIGTGLPPDRSFPARLAERWRGRGLRVEVANLGVNGYATDDLVREELPRVRAFAPTLATLLVGTNDLVRGRDAASYGARLRAILVALARDGVAAPRILVLAPPDWSRSPEGSRYGDPVELARGVDAYARVAREEASRAGARFLDLVPLSRQESARGLFAPDGLHFGADAYDEWAERIDAELAAAGLVPAASPS